jgi:hypothetical protein
VGPQGMRAPYSNMSNAVAIAAPGGDMSQGEQGGVWQNTARKKKPSGIFQLGPNPAVDGFYALQGTSMATPHVSGVAALLVSQGVKDPARIRSILRNTATPKTPANEYGAGVMDAGKAVQSVKKSGQGSGIGLWAIAAVAAFLLLRPAGSKKASQKKKNAPPAPMMPLLIAFAAGWVAPLALEKLFGYGSLLNLAGHSVALAVIWLLTPDMPRSALRQAAAFTAGTMLHLALDARSGVTPLQVTPESRIMFWLWVNIAVGAYYLYSAYQQQTAAVRGKSR